MSLFTGNELDKPMAPESHRGVRRARCVNRKCSEHDIEKVVRLPHCGDGVYALGTLICGTCDCPVWMSAR